MLRFFESEVDSWWSTAAAPPQPQPPLTIKPKLQVGMTHYNQSYLAPPMTAAPACRRVPPALNTVDLVKGRWLPATTVETSYGSSLSSPNSSSSADSICGGCGIISWQSNDAFHIETSLDPSLAQFQVERSSLISMDGGRTNQHEAMLDLRQHRREIDANKNIVVVRDCKRQKIDFQEEKLHCFASSESTSLCSLMMTTQQPIKAPVKKSQKLGDKITSLQKLVSPFGKADTASVLHEAAEYIKALHKQVKMLSKPYVEQISCPDGIQGIKNGVITSHYKLSSLRGERLCVVPISPSIISLVNQELLDDYTA